MRSLELFSHVTELCSLVTTRQLGQFSEYRLVPASHKATAVLLAGEGLDMGRLESGLFHFNPTALAALFGCLNAQHAGHGGQHRRPQLLCELVIAQCRRIRCYMHTVSVLHSYMASSECTAFEVNITKALLAASSDA